MSVSKDRIELVLSRFAVLFPRPVQLATGSDLVDVWHSLMDGVDEAAFGAACFQAARKLTRFPFPADVLGEVALLAANTQEEGHA